MAQLGQPKSTAFSEEDVCIISKEQPCAVWVGTKILYSGLADATPQQASGYNFGSGESDIEPVSLSGWGRIRVPELSQLHKVFVFPKEPRLLAADNYTTLTLGTTSGLPSGTGGCSGKVALINYLDICNLSTSGVHEGCLDFESGNWTSGLVDIVAFGSQF